MPLKFGVLPAFASLGLIALGLLSLGSVNADDTKKTGRANKSNDSAIAQLELFVAIEKEAISVRFTPAGAHKATVIFTNNGDDAVDIQLPAAFGAVPVLAQLGGPGGFQGGGFQGGGFQGGGLQGGGLQGGGGGQGLGGGFGGGNFGGGGIGGGGIGGFGGGNFGGGNFGGGMFRIEGQKSRKLSVACVCLEYGKPDPTPRMKYQLVPLEQVNDSPAIQVLCAALGEKKVNQVVAQAAAWNIANGLSWQQLTKINRVESQFTGNERFFTRDQLVQASQVADQCRQLTEAHYVTSNSTATEK